MIFFIDILILLNPFHSCSIPGFSFSLSLACPNTSCLLLFAGTDGPCGSLLCCGLQAFWTEQNWNVSNICGGDMT